MQRATVEIDYKVFRVKGAGLQRVRRTKSEAGHRTLPLPLFAMRMLERRITTSGGAGPSFRTLAVDGGTGSAPDRHGPLPKPGRVLSCPGP